jgi:multidrug efflux pump subunit AcrB
MGGLNLLTNAYTSNNASLIVMLKPWEERKSAEEKLQPILAAARKDFAAYPEAISLVFPPPPINGLGNASGFVFELQDKAGRSPQELAEVKDKFMRRYPKATNSRASIPRTAPPSRKSSSTSTATRPVR